MKVTKRVHFDAAHKLPDYDGLCSQLHGHRWELEVTVDGPVLSGGMVTDFKVLGEIIDSCVLQSLDHEYLNNQVQNPTAENLCLWIGTQLAGFGLPWFNLKLWEAPDSCVELSRNEYEETRP